MREEIKILKEKNNQLTAAFKKYADHHGRCSTSGYGITCDCGYAETKKAVEGGA